MPPAVDSPDPSLKKGWAISNRPCAAFPDVPRIGGWKPPLVPRTGPARTWEKQGCSGSGGFPTPATGKRKTGGQESPLAFLRVSPKKLGKSIGDCNDDRFEVRFSARGDRGKGTVTFSSRLQGGGRFRFRWPRGFETIATLGVLELQTPSFGFHKATTVTGNRADGSLLLPWRPSRLPRPGHARKAR